MNFRDLEYLVAVARFAHFGKVAEHCHVSQSTLSVQLQKLEREVGAQLLERTSRSVVVTEAGKEAVRRARELLQQKLELIDASGHFGGGLPEVVRVGAIPTIAPYLLVPLQRGFSRAHPNTCLRFNEMVTQDLTAAVVRGELEVGISPRRSRTRCWMKSSCLKNLYYSPFPPGIPWPKAATFVRTNLTPHCCSSSRTRTACGNRWWGFAQSKELPDNVKPLRAA